MKLDRLWNTSVAVFLSVGVPPADSRDLRGWEQAPVYLRDSVWHSFHWQLPLRHQWKAWWPDQWVPASFFPSLSPSYFFLCQLCTLKIFFFHTDIFSFHTCPKIIANYCSQLPSFNNRDSHPPIFLQCYLTVNCKLSVPFREKAGITKSVKEKKIISFDLCFLSCVF